MLGHRWRDICGAPLPTLVIHTSKCLTLTRPSGEKRKRKHTDFSGFVTSDPREVLGMIQDPDFSDWVAEHGSDDSFDSRGESEGEGEGVACAGNERDIARLLRAMVCLS